MLPMTLPAVASQGNTSSENLPVTRVKNHKAFLCPSSPEIPVGLTMGLKKKPGAESPLSAKDSLCWTEGCVLHTGPAEASLNYSVFIWLLCSGTCFVSHLKHLKPFLREWLSWQSMWKLHIVLRSFKISFLALIQE